MRGGEPQGRGIGFVDGARIGGNAVDSRAQFTRDRAEPFARGRERGGLAAAVEQLGAQPFLERARGG